jgi:hypothetical protein
LFLNICWFYLFLNFKHLILILNHRFVHEDKEGHHIMHTKKKIVVCVKSMHCLINFALLKDYMCDIDLTYIKSDLTRWGISWNMFAFSKVMFHWKLLSSLNLKINKMKHIMSCFQFNWYRWMYHCIWWQSGLY